jgi:putative peptidoglycan lipid II flippase
VSTALFWFSFSLPFAGVNLLLTRTFFSLQSPWAPTALAGLTLVINAGVSTALYGPLGIAGVVLGTVVATIAMTIGQAAVLRHRTGGLELPRTISTTAKIIVASAILGAVAYGSWYVLDQALGRSLPAQVISVGGSITIATGVYALVVLAMRVPEARQIADLFAQRFRRA